MLLLVGPNHIYVTVGARTDRTLRQPILTKKLLPASSTVDDADSVYFVKIEGCPVRNDVTALGHRDESLSITSESIPSIRDRITAYDSGKLVEPLKNSAAPIFVLSTSFRFSSSHAIRLVTINNEFFWSLMRFPSMKMLPEAIIINDEEKSESTAEVLSCIDLTQSSDDSSQLDSQPLQVTKTEDFFISHDTTESVGQSSRFIIDETKHSVLSASLTPRKNKETSHYSDGKFSAAKVKFHMNPTSIPILDTPGTGILHVVLGWRSSEILSDLCYRYVTSGSWNAKKCGFLEGNHLMRKKMYKCNGIAACPVLLRSRESFNHATEEEWIALQAMVKKSHNRVDLMEMRMARNLYVTLTNPEVQFCTARTIEGVEHTISHAKCDGRPVLRQVRATKEWFVGCTHYYLKRDTKSRHYFHSLRSFTEKARGYLQEMLENKKPLTIPEEICEYVAVKKGRGQKRCATHGVDLVHSGTDGSSNGRCGAKMILYEPIEEKPGRDECLVTFALCIGSHNHPPPKQAASTERKNSMFRSLAEGSPYTTAAALKLDAQDTMLSGKRSAMQNPELSRNFMYNTLGAVRRKKEKDDYTSLFNMMENPETNYVRDVRVMNAGFAFLLATDDMLRLGSEAVSFAGDATYKTVMERDAHYITPEWYLYNIVAPEDITTPSVKGIVVGRALMTSLKTEAYAAVWEMFILHMRRAKAESYGLDLKEVSLNVPYMELEPERKKNAIEIRAITTDYEAAEVEGIACALADQRGGSIETHIENAMIGCEVHFERAFKKRAAFLKPDEQKEFKGACKRLLAATSLEEGDEAYATIANMDDTWSSWLSLAHIRPLIAPCFSRMSQSHRMMAFRDTNTVESQNRRANLICGTRLNPVRCAQRLMKLDSVSGTLACLLKPSKPQIVPRTRTRNGHTLQPSGAGRSEAAERQRGRKRKVSEGSKGKATKKKHIKETETNEDMSHDDNNAHSALDRIVGSEISESLLWLHNELGIRCRKAVEDGDETLLVALSGLYRSVLESDNINKIKYRILDTINKEKGNKQITREFSKVLVLISEKQAQSLRDRQEVKGQDNIISPTTDVRRLPDDGKVMSID